MVLSKFRPLESFGRFEHRYSSEPVRYAMVGPSSVIINWFPVYTRKSEIQHQALRELWDKDPSLKNVLKTGNRQPPTKYSGPTDFIRDLETNDFRAAIAIDQPTIFLDHNLRPVLIELLAMSRIGYTNVRLGKVTFPFEGVGNACGHTLDNGIHIRLFVRVKLGPLGQIMAKLLTRNWPPNATAVIDYIMDPTRRLVEVSFSGTVFPTQTCYVDWKSIYEYRIEDLSIPTYESFVQSEGCQDALLRLPYKHSAPADVQAVTAPF